VKGSGQQLLERKSLPLAAVIDGENDGVVVSEFADALAAATAGRAGADITDATDDRNFHDTLAAFLHHRGDGTCFSAAAERVGGVLDIAAHVQVAAIIHQRRADPVV